MDQRLKDLGTRFGGNFGGSGVAPLPSVGTINKGVYFDPQTSQHFTLDNGQPKYITPPAYQNGGTVSKFAHWIGGVGTQIGHIAGGAATWVGHTLTTAVEAPIKFGYDFTTGAVGSYMQHNQVNQLAEKEQNLNKQYQSGRINKDQFLSAMGDISKQSNDLSKTMQLTQQHLENSRQEGINTAADLVTIATGGLGKVPSMVASRFLGSTAADSFLNSASQTIGKVAANKTLFDGLSTGAKQALQKATAEVVATAPQATAGQIARASAINLAFKYPLYFAWASGTGTDLYHELDQKKYGNAVKTAAFNGALLLSGGPIGYALKYGGKAVKGVTLRTFGQSSFIDALSRGIGNGDEKGLFNAIRQLPQKDQEDIIKQLSAVEATNLGAVGKDPIAAAQRVLRGMESYEGLSMNQFTHEEALMNMVNFAKAQRLADEAGKAAGLGVVTVGRLDARSLSDIAKNLSDIPQANRLQVWEQLKSQASEQAWANNENFDRQIKALIEKHASSEDLTKAITSIKAAIFVKDFPKPIADQLAKMGYIPIKPSNLEAPFQEGSGTLSTKFADGQEFFTKAVQPLPVLRQVGALLTGLGLSPFASTHRAYELFNTQVSANLKELGITKQTLRDMNAKFTASGKSEVSSVFSKQELVNLEKQGYTPEMIAKLEKGSLAEGAIPAPIQKVAPSEAPKYTEQDATDTIIKKLSSYAKHPDRRLLSRVPATDLRMLTVKDIQTALKTTHSEARDIQRAISEAYIQVPTGIRGLGDKLVDLTYAFTPTAILQRRYLRVMGAARFGYNPFFQYLRVIPKTETLASFEGGGYISTIFKGQASKLNDIRSYLRVNKFLEKPGFGTYTEEATAAAGTSANLTKKLLPTQEKSIAGLLNAQADKLGMDWKTFVDRNPQQVRDTIQMIAEYDKRSSFLNSPLARTLNIAFFPFRFDTKVAIIMTRNLAKTGLVTQVAVVNGLLRAHEWMNTDEGRAWYAANSDAIGLFKYITPVASFNEIFHSLLPGHDHSLGNFGELGGLPFGWIPQLLDAEGLTHFNQPGASPKTGELYTEHIPASARGQVATAVQDLLGSMFSYPGATIGLPSKTSITHNVASGVTSANPADFQDVHPTPTPEQAAYQQSINKGSTPPPNLPPTTAPGFTLPPQNFPAPTKVLTRREVAALKSRSSVGRLKSKALPIPPRGQ